MDQFENWDYPCKIMIRVQDTFLIIGALRAIPYIWGEVYLFWRVKTLRETILHPLNLRWEKNHSPSFWEILIQIIMVINKHLYIN